MTYQKDYRSKSHARKIAINYGGTVQQNGNFHTVSVCSQNHFSNDFEQIKSFFKNWRITN